MRKATSTAPKTERLSPEVMAQLKAAAALPDEQINTSDPDAPEALDWSGATRGRLYSTRQQGGG